MSYLGPAGHRTILASSACDFASPSADGERHTCTYIYIYTHMI